MSTRLIAELGSCHMGKIERLKEAVDRCKVSAIDHLKFQLFPNDDKYTKVGNVWLSHELFREVFLYGKESGVSVSASVFDLESYYFLRNLQPDFIKFAFSMKETSWMIKDCLDHGFEAIVSCDVMTDHLVDRRATKLYCIPEYPVRYEVAFDDLFHRFHGFSDHTLGTRQTKRAIEAGAQIIEKHVRLGHEDETCPDARFAVLIEDFAKVR
jgi:sialic acid synthase SpsE